MHARVHYACASLWCACVVLYLESVSVKSLARKTNIHERMATPTRKRKYEEPTPHHVSLVCVVVIATRPRTQTSQGLGFEMLVTQGVKDTDNKNNINTNHCTRTTS